MAVRKAVKEGERFVCFLKQYKKVVFTNFVKYELSHVEEDVEV